MSVTWVTTVSNSPEAVVTALNAACEAGVIPSTLRFLSNPDVTDQVDPTTRLAERIVTAYGQTEPSLMVTTLDKETDFTGIANYHQTTIQQAQESGEDVAVDVTPGRKFMSAIAFQAGIQYDADHVFYLLLGSSRYYDLLYPEIPRTGLELIDFTERLS